VKKLKYRHTRILSYASLVLCMAICDGNPAEAQSSARAKPWSCDDIRRMIVATGDRAGILRELEGFHRSCPMASAFRKMVTDLGLDSAFVTAFARTCFTGTLLTIARSEPQRVSWRLGGNAILGSPERIELEPDDATVLSLVLGEWRDKVPIKHRDFTRYFARAREVMANDIETPREKPQNEPSRRNWRPSTLSAGLIGLLGGTLVSVATCRRSTTTRTIDASGSAMDQSSVGIDRSCMWRNAGGGAALLSGARLAFAASVGKAEAAREQTRKAMAVGVRIAVTEEEFTCP
jgi:hypothetical protein